MSDLAQLVYALMKDATNCLRNKNEDKKILSLLLVRKFFKRQSIPLKNLAELFDSYYNRSLTDGKCDAI